MVYNNSMYDSAFTVFMYKSVEVHNDTLLR